MGNTNKVQNTIKVFVLNVYDKIKSYFSVFNESFSHIDEKIPYGTHEFLWINMEFNINSQSTYYTAELIDDILVFYLLECDPTTGNKLMIITSYQLNPEWVGFITQDNFKFTESNEKISIVLNIEDSKSKLSELKCNYFVFNHNPKLKILEIGVPVEIINILN